MKHKTANKTLSLLLTLCMVIGLLPIMSMTASAADVSTMEISPSEPTVAPGGTQQFTVKVDYDDQSSVENSDKVAWTIDRNTSDDTSISNAGLLTVGADETAETIDVIATSTENPNTSTFTTVTIGGTGSSSGVLMVNGVNLLTADEDDWPENVAYDSEANTLTLSGANLSTASLQDTHYAVIYADSGLNIVLEDENDISYSGEVPEGAETISGIYCTGDVTIAGSGSLHLQNGMQSKSGAKFIDICVGQVGDSSVESDLTIQGGATVNINGASDKLGGADVCGILVSKNLKVEAGASLIVTTRDSNANESSLVPTYNNAIRTTGSITLGGTITAKAGVTSAYPKESIAIKAATIAITGETASLYATGEHGAFYVPQMTGIPATMQLLGGLTYGDPEPSTPYTITDGKASLSAAGQKAAFLRLTPIAGHGTGNTHTPEHTGQTCNRNCWYPVTQAVINENNGELPNYHYHNLYQYYLTEDIVVTKSLTLSTGETLCLNGHSITLSDEAPEGTPVITVSYSNAYDGTVICDCRPEAHAGDPTYGYWVQTGTKVIEPEDEWDDPVTIPTYEYKLTKTLSEVSDEVMPHDTITGGYITGGKGGGIAIDSFNSDEKTGVFVYNCTIAGNVNSDNGGGVTGGRKRLYLNNTQIVGNQSQEDGGGLYSTYTSTTYYYPSGVQINDGTVISHNIALDNGGGIGATKAILNGEVKVEENLSLNGSGGGIYANGLEVAPGEDKTVSISGNKAAVNGGGVAVDTSSTKALKLANAKIEDNEAGENGGGVSIAVAFEKGDGYSTVENCSVSNNIAGENGGGLYIDALSKSSYSYYNFGAELTETPVAQNTAKLGGGVYLWAHNYYYNASSEQPLILKAGTSITQNKATQWGGGVVLENTGARLVFDGGMVADDNTLSDGTTVSTIGLSGAKQDSRYTGYLPQLVFETGFNESDEITLGVSVAEGTFSGNDSTVYYYFYEDDLPDNVSIKNEGDYGILSFHNYYTSNDKIFFTLPAPMVRLSGDFPSYEVYGNQGNSIPVTYQWNHMQLSTPVPVTDADAETEEASYAEGVWSIVRPWIGPVGEETSMCGAWIDVFYIDLQKGESISFTTPKSLLDYLNITFQGQTYSFAPTLEGYDSDETIKFTYEVNGDSLIWKAAAPESDEYELRIALYYDNGVSAETSAQALYSYVTEILKLTNVKKAGYEVESAITPIDGPSWEGDPRTYSESLFLRQMTKGEAYAVDVTYKQPQKEKDKYETEAASWDDAQPATIRSEVIFAKPLIFDAYTETTYQPNPYTANLSAMFFFFDPIPGTEDVTVQYQNEEGEWVTKAENENLTLTQKLLADILDEWTELEMPSDYRPFYEQVLTDYYAVQLPLDGTYDAGRYKLVITAVDGDKTVSTEDMPYTPGLYINTAPNSLDAVEGGEILSGIASTYTFTVPDGYTYTQKDSLPTGVQSATVSGNTLTIVTTAAVPEGDFSLTLNASKKNYKDCDLTVHLTGIKLPSAETTISGLADSTPYDGQAVTASASSPIDDNMVYTYTWQKNTGTESNPVWTTLDGAPKAAGSYKLIVIGLSSEHMDSIERLFTIAPKALTWDVSDLSAAKRADSEAEANVYGLLKVSGTLSGDDVTFTSPAGMTTNGLSGTAQEVGDHENTPLKRASGEWNSLTLTGTDAGNYTLPTAAPAITAVVNKVEGNTEADPLPVPPEEEPHGYQMKLKMEHGISDVPALLASDPERNTPAKIENAMMIAITTQNASVADENKAAFDVSLMVSTDNGVSWTEATTGNFPAEGLTVTLPYPEGTNSSYRFTVVHMFTQNALGKTAGEVEYPAVTNTAQGIQFKVTSLSPIAVGWMAPSTGGSGGGVTTYSINLPSSIPNGKLTSDRKTASKGTTVTITATPDDGYTLDTLTVTDKDGKQLTVTAASSGKYTFTMPAGKVTVSASFVKSGDAPCGKTNCPVGRFTDTSVTAWYHDGVHYCVENGLMNGNSATTFNPNGTTTRSQIVVILWRLEGSPVVNYAMDLSDIPSDVYYTEAVRWAQANGIVTGYADGTFKPNSPITREQMVAILYRYAKYKGHDVSVGENTNILSYGDASKIAEYAVPAMQWACGSGVVTGKNAANGSGLILDPKGSTTRAQMATMMMRFCADIVK